MHKILEDIICSSQKRARHLQPEPFTINAKSLKKSIEKAQESELVPIISEVKPASPTQNFKKITPVYAAQIAGEMERAGACAISVLTEPNYFHGSIENLKSVREQVNLPVLRKDFIVSKNQITEVETDMVLLIAGVLHKQLNKFITEVEKTGAIPIVEVHSPEELEEVLSTDAQIIGINNRNLNTFEIDLEAVKQIAPMIRKERADAIIIAESGVRTPEDALQMIESGADAILVGSAIMEGNAYTNTYKLVHAGK
ncbi:MAG: Indole-3-glycerol phosphate synthase [Candidatus Argoarchaeum ethanivorans]|uniref:Indole-3-glycerol phosphate synthase n=1 Tax=Candidatus Argoarchaeum ethanivorans TaxID=2608793 RepID=A0A811TBP4_9EURY|nr:MAG: Indole-3-glycerol phosphate synthase [Candidatus Argoarchaeum ethanivorans]